jgi:type I restriction enzyme S subunit
MNSKVETRAMKQASKQVSTPKLRFPGFNDPWGHKNLAPYLEDCSSRVSSVTNLPVYTSARSGLHRQEDYYGGRVLINENEYGVVPVGCFVYRHMSDDGKFIFHMNDTGGAIAVSKEYPVFKAVNVVPQFLLAKLNHSADFKAFAMSQKAGGTRTRLYFSKLRDWATMLPSISEQQKIADCLSSLDEVIAAQARKVNALNDHKTGLMQQLFPRHGETLPRLRLPEFRDARDWASIPLGELLSRKPEYGVNAAAVPFSDDLPTYLRITDISEDGQFISETKASVDIDAADEHYLVEGDIVLARTGASTGKSYRYRKEDGKLVFAGFLIRVRPNPKKLNPTFLSNFLSTVQYWDWVRITSTRSGQPGINGSEYATLPVPIPPNDVAGDGLSEQQRIADCLSSIDAQIATETRKLKTLKIHKSGLMQQLFPLPAEVEG